MDYLIEMEKLFIGAKMIRESFPSRTIEFFLRIYPSVKKGEKLSQREMSILYGCTPQAAKKHVDVLTARHYLYRVHYRLWEVERVAIDTAELRQLLELKVQMDGK